MSKGKVFSFGLAGKRVCDALGIPNLIDASINFPLDGLVRADVSFYLTPDQVERLFDMDLSEEIDAASFRKTSGEEMKEHLRNILGRKR